MVYRSGGPMAKLKLKSIASVKIEKEVLDYLKEKGLNDDVTTWTPAEMREFAAWVRFMKKDN